MCTYGQEAINFANGERLEGRDVEVNRTAFDIRRHGNKTTFSWQLKVGDNASGPKG